MLLNHLKQGEQNKMTTQSEQLREMRIPESRLEVRMPLLAYEIFKGLNPYYEIRAVDDSGSCRGIAKVTHSDFNFKEFPFCEVTSHLFPYGGDSEIVGFASTFESAKEIAHKEALLLANQISALNRDIPVKDYSWVDRQNLEASKKINSGCVEQ